ncbi:MAG: polymer-forming cytoskeletal protein [Ferruginibacter sp.]
MFTSKSKSGINDPAVGSCSMLGAGTTIVGDIESNSDIRLDGTIKGNIRCKAKVIIGAEAVVEGSVHCRHADIFGHVKGGLEVSDLLQLKGKAIIDGDISTGKLMMENTVSFNGQCRMGANIVELNNEQLPLAVNG